MSRAPYLSDAPSVSTIMAKVLLALVPAIFTYAWLFGGSILITLVLATCTALATEALLLRLRQRPIRPFLSDFSVIITAWLLALSIPPLSPWWLIVVGTAFAVIFAKHLYGGLGYNPFNPAMVGYAVLLISFPVLMTRWPAALSLAEHPLQFAEQCQYIFSGVLPAPLNLDAVTSATPLDHLKTQLRLSHSVDSITQSPIFGGLAGAGNPSVAVAYMLGGLYLWQQRIISWHLPLGFFGVMILVSGAFWLVDPQQYASPLFHLFAGASMLGAFFIITDPVSGPTTPVGKLWFAGGVALLTYVIRVFGGFPDGMAFAVLLMNIAVPLIDAYTQPRVFGHLK